MGFFGPSAIEEAVFRQMERLRWNAWGNVTDGASDLDQKEKRIDTLAAELLKTEDVAIRKAQKRWIAGARESIKYYRQGLAREKQIASFRLPPLISH